MLYQHFIPLFFRLKNHKMILFLILDNFLFSGYLACQQIGPLGGIATFGIPVVRSLGSIASPITLTAQPLEPRVNETHSFTIISYQELVWKFLIVCFKMVTLNMSQFSYSCKIERENGISHLISVLCVNCKFTSECNSGIFQKYSRNIPECWLLNNLVVHLVWTASEIWKIKNLTILLTFK